MGDEAGATLLDRVLDAAEGVVVRQGIANLTLEAVAADAGLSKGGLLYHFPSKDKLIEAMVVRCSDHWRAHTEEMYQAVPEGPGRMARGLLRHLEDAEAWTEQCHQSSCAVFAALAQNPELIDPMRAVHADLAERLRQEDLPVGVGETIIAAMNGLWLCRVLGLSVVDPGLLGRIRAVLVPLVSESSTAATKPPSDAAKTPGKARRGSANAGSTASPAKRSGSGKKSSSNRKKGRA